ncbi:MAG: metal-binding protein [Thermoplasmataceae archaeon]
MPESYAERVISFDRISISRPEITGKSIRGKISVTSDNLTESFTIIFTYSESMKLDERIAGLILTMPAINFTYFARELHLDFPITEEDRSLLETFLKVNAREIFINKICRRRYEFIRKEYIPGEEDINEHNADGITVLIAGTTRKRYDVHPVPGNAVVLSSGGKESLLSYGMMKEIGSRVFSFFFNESGGHWITAKTSYDYFSSHFPDTVKVWSNVDRFYKFMQRRVRILDQMAITRWADTYPIQLFIFPVYVFSLLPIVINHGISTILLGDEFDDPRDMPDFHGMKHYFGVFDQSTDFNRIMSDYLKKIGINAVLTSVVYPVFGNVVERILVNRYPELFSLQRSCHSCHYENGKIVPCGKCSKCLGILMFVHSAGGDPADICYGKISDDDLRERVESVRMRLDTDEMAYLRKLVIEHGNPTKSHVTGIHLLDVEKSPGQLIPIEFRNGIMKIISQYSSGIFELRNGEWAEKT